MEKLVIYDQALVAYLDILGFRELVQTETAGRISRTIRVVRDAVKPTRDRRRVYEMTYQSFSDLTVISIPILTAANLTIRPGVLLSQIHRLAAAQVELLYEGIVLRGALTFGSIVRSYGQLFGPALIRAYDLERTKAKYPRIVIDDVIFRELERNPALATHSDERDQILSLLEQDDDGYHFIDCLRAFRLNTDARSFRKIMRRHRETIKMKLHKFEDERGVLEKYTWLAEYHNRSVKKLRMRRQESILI